MATLNFCVNTRMKTIRNGWINKEIAARSRLVRAFSLFSSHISHNAGKDAEHGQEREPVVVGETCKVENGKEQHTAVDERQTDMLGCLSRYSLKKGEGLDKEGK
jgi:hypothetical protein